MRELLFKGKEGGELDTVENLPIKKQTRAAHHASSEKRIKQTRRKGGRAISVSRGKKICPRLHLLKGVGSGRSRSSGFRKGRHDAR